MKSTDEMTYFGIVHQVPILQYEGFDYLMELLRQHKCKSFLEIGTAIGRTALQAASLDPEMRVVTIEKNPEMAAQARENIKAHPNGKQVLLVEGDARETEIPPGPYDVIFIDAAKGQYRRFFQRYAPMLADGGIIVSDNMNFHGLVQHPERTKNRHTRALIRRINDYRAFLDGLEDYETQLLEIGDGLAITRRKADV
ncbi:MAG: O-methyltransferase [Erysipelotrichaceae bacterium]|nr:O-methyltransferase [Erysipelotrichaceae bacterium]